MKRIWLAIALLFAGQTLIAESQPEDLGNVQDPFGDPSAYEFAEDEKADKEFFHLGRFLMFGFDAGASVYTGGLGRSADPGGYFGARLIYFFDRQIAFEAAAHYSKQLDGIRTANLSANIDTTIIPLTLGFRYYFNTKTAPRAIAIANPYVGFGGGAYLRQQEVLDSQPTFQIAQASNSQFGVYAAAGIEFDIYRRHLYLGADLRYHMIFFFDEDDTLGGGVSPGDRGGRSVYPGANDNLQFLIPARFGALI